MSEERPRYGWASDLPTFRGTEPRVVCLRLCDFVRDASTEQRTAWGKWVPDLQIEADALLRTHEPAKEYTAILEYELPRDSRRPDVIVLEGGVVVVLELKGRPTARRAGLDQVNAYARDLHSYHAACHERPVVPVLVVTNGPDPAAKEDGAWVVGPRGIHALLAQLSRTLSGPPLKIAEFLDVDAYAPLPSIVSAARELFQNGELPFLKRARATTDPALRAITSIALEAARSKTRHLAVLTGVPGSGKTLVGMQLVHAHWLDELAVARAKGKPRAPAVFLSGNDPLVDVLQHALRGAGGGGAAFVQKMKKYVRTYLENGDRTPPEHLVVFDEAQRAHDSDQAAKVHKADGAKSEPQLLLEILARVPEWCVLVALVGSGQSIHQGEEGGLSMWRDALQATGCDWTVHAAASVENVFAGSPCLTRWNPALNLDTEIRHHLVPRVQRFVSALVDEGDAAGARGVATALFVGGIRYWCTRNLEAAKEYLRDRYADAPSFRYGLIASAKDKVLPHHGVDNTFLATKRVRYGPWFNAAPGDSASCCQLRDVATEFKVQGLELDMALLAWGSDLLRVSGRWSIARASRTKRPLRDPEAIRRNVYRVLLTRGRDGTIVFVPPGADFDETFVFLLDCGMRPLET